MKKKSNLLVNVVIAVSIIGAIVQLYLSIAHDIGQPAFSLVFLSIPVMVSRLKQYKKMANDSDESRTQFSKSVKVGLIAGRVAIIGFVLYFLILLNA